MGTLSRVFISRVPTPTLGIRTILVGAPTDRRRSGDAKQAFRAR